MSTLLSWLRSLLADHRSGLSDAEVHAQLADLAREHLGVGEAEALRMLRSGELDGTAIEVELRSRLFLLGEPSPRSTPSSKAPPEARAAL